MKISGLDTTNFLSLRQFNWIHGVTWAPLKDNKTDGVHFWKKRRPKTETNTKYIIERNSERDHSKDGNTQTPYEDKPTPLRPTFRSHDNIMTCCLSPAEDEVFLLDNRIRKHDSEPFMVHSSDPKTSNFMKRLWGYEDVPEQKSSSTMHKFPSNMTIDHEPTDDCYLCTWVFLISTK